MSQRLTELQRQRALIQEHLAWLDREIAAEKLLTRASTPPVPAAVSPAPEEKPAAVAADPDAIIAQYRNDTQSLQSNVRRGCFLYFFLALGVVGLGVLVLYYFYSTGR